MNLSTSTNSFLEMYTQLTKIDPDTSLKEEVRGILRDYRNFWDVYAELLQNSVDAINRRYRVLNDTNYYMYKDFNTNNPNFNDGNYRGKIEIRVDTTDNTITVLDNGVGIEKENLMNFLLPKSSGKKMRKDYGFKGYGLTFVAFVSRKFSAKSRYFTDLNCFEYEINNIFDWVYSDSNPFPGFPEVPTSSDDQDLQEWNTKITVRLEDDYYQKFDAVAALDFSKKILKTEDDLKRFEYILRTKTAIGNTKSLFSKPPIVPIDIKLVVKFPNEQEVEREIEYSYYHPINHKEISVNSYEFANYVTQMNSADFIRGFRGLSHTKSSHIVGKKQPIKCDIHLAAISSTRLGNVERELGLDKLKQSNAKITCGIFLSIDGMPTGIRLDAWGKKGGEYKRYYVVVDCKLDISNTLDSGRKGITDHYAGLIDDEVVELINNLRKGGSDTFGHYATRDLDIGKVKPPGVGFGLSDFQRDIKTAEKNIEKDLRDDPITVSKIKRYSPLLAIPHSEQEVVALFYSLLSAGIIKGYNTFYQAGSEKVYDAAFSYNLDLNNSVEPDDPLGFGSISADDLKSQGFKEYDHTIHYAYNTVFPQICAEFKLNVGGLLYELKGQTNKDPNQIDLLIVWDTNVSSQIPSNSYTLAPVIESRRLYHASTHRLGIIGVRSTDIYVISLKDVLNRLP
ncbi:UNVERIFIED_ORG: histidine kinase/DNA gyrase B/HSP90-like ATPase [Bacillus cereus]